MMKVCFIGSGAWATALANVVSDNNHEAVLYGIIEEEINDININHQNSKYFNEIKINSNITATLNIEEALKDSEIVVIAVPSNQIRNVLQKIEKIINSRPIILNVSKGFDNVTHKRLSEVIKESIDNSKIAGVVSLIGPSYAEEVISRYYTAICSVSSSIKCAEKVQEVFSNQYFRVYTNTDEIGSEVGAGIKNVIAIASGILTGLGYKDNSRAALITRGLAEIARYGVALGANQKTFAGLTGIGDLFLTCSSKTSRNYSCGIEIGKLDSSYEFLKNNNKTIEGIYACKIIHESALKLNIDMPIVKAVYEVLYNNKKPSEELANLMKRELKGE